MFIFLYLLKEFEVYDIIDFFEVDNDEEIKNDEQNVNENEYIVNNPVLKNISIMKNYYSDKLLDIISTEIDSGSTRI